MDRVGEVISVAYRNLFKAEHLAEIEEGKDFLEAIFLEDRQ